MSTPTAIQPRGLTINKGLPRQLFNRLISAMLRSPLHGLFGLSRVMLVFTYTGRKSGQDYSLPLVYQRDGGTLTTFALFTNTVWWKNLRGGAPVTVRVAGQDRSGHAITIEDPTQVAAGLFHMAEAMPRMAGGGYYGIPRHANGQPDQDALIDIAKTRIMIRIQLQ